MRVRIRIVGTQAFDGQSDTVTQTADGELTFAGGAATLRYTERDDEGVTTDVTVAADTRQVLVRRSGAAKSTLCLRCGEQCQSVYGTPYGDFEVTTVTHQLRNTLGEAGGEISLAYTLSLGGQTMENTLCMTIERNELS